jgi:urea transporter
MSARGIGQVIFLNSPTSGAVVLGGLAIGSPYLASLAALGAVTATVTAKAAQIDGDALQAGLWGYNGCLVGCAAAVFGPASIVAATTSTLIGAAASPLVAASLKETMSIPQWTYAFNIVALTSLLRTRPFLAAPATEEAAEVVTATTATTTGFGDLVLAPFVGISQIFVVESALSGAVITYGIGMHSPGLAAHAVVGSAVGSLVGVLSGADLSELAIGLWGFNSALTSMAVGVFFVHSAPTVFGAMKTIFGAYGAPCLTLPFCTTMSACYLLHKQIPALQLAKDPHSPEQNSA